MTTMNTTQFLLDLKSILTQHKQLTERHEKWKEYMRDYYRQYYHNNKQQMKQNNKKSYQKNIHKRIQHHKEYYERNRAVILGKARLYRQRKKTEREAQVNKTNI